MDRFTDRRIVVTGAGSGMGRAVALRLLREGGHVAALDLSAGGLADTAKVAADEGFANRLATATVDIADEAEVARVVAGALDTLGGLDVLVNAAGILRAAHTEECPLELWQQVIGTNLTGTFLVTRAALPALVASGRGVVVNFASTAAFAAHPYMAAYAASKGGIVAFTHTIALEYAKRGVRAVAVAPGGVDTPLVGGLAMPDDADPGFYRRLMPVGRGFASPDEIAGMVAAVASDDGAYVNGTTIHIDGGTHA
ncbi:MAG: SDR family oxidoreductase [Actinobacteria bacterium]|nr:SDR family oxidoreductase [Actinomycetota bacterium]